MAFAQRVAGRYAPQVGSFLTVRLPGELMRCEVVRLVDAHRVMIEISGVPISRAHQYRQGDCTGARRRTEFGRDVWEALDDRDFLANRSPTEPVEPERQQERITAKGKSKPAKRKAAPKKKAKAKKKAAASAA